MSRVHETVMHQMRLLRMNAHKAVEKALVKSKSDKALSEKEMEELRGEVEPFIRQLDDCVSEHIERLKEKEGDHDEEKEEWDMQAEHAHIMCQQCLDLWRLQKEAAEKASEVEEVMGDATGATLWGMVARLARRPRNRMSC